VTRPAEEPFPFRRAAIGCAGLAAVLLVGALLVRPAIFFFAPPRDDGAIAVATLTEVTAGPVRRDLILSRSYGWTGERDAGDGRVQLAVILAPTPTGSISAVNAASPGRLGCAVEIGADRLTDCGGRAWTFDGVPIDSADPPLERVGVEVVSGSVVLDLTGPVER
jgi:hypothetical protein